MTIDMELYIDLLQEEVYRLRYQKPKRSALARTTGTTDQEVATTRTGYTPPKNLTSDPKTFSRSTILGDTNA